MKINITEFHKSDATSEAEFSDHVFAVPFREGLIHQVVTSIAAAKRQGTKRQKTRSDVKGGGAKPWRQKGTGRARAGTIRSPIWRTGGVTFAARNRNFAKKINKKEYNLALRSVLSELLRMDRLRIVENLDLETPKTKKLLALVHAFGVQNCLLVDSELSDNLILAARNLPHVTVLQSSELNPYNLIKEQHVVMTRRAVTLLDEALQA